MILILKFVILQSSIKMIEMNNNELKSTQDRRVLLL